MEWHCLILYHICRTPQMGINTFPYGIFSLIIFYFIFNVFPKDRKHNPVTADITRNWDRNVQAIQNKYPRHKQNRPRLQH